MGSLLRSYILSMHKLKIIFHVRTVFILLFASLCGACMSSGSNILKECTLAIVIEYSTCVFDQRRPCIYINIMGSLLATTY